MIATAGPRSNCESQSHSHPNLQIESMTGRRHLSWSQLSTYRGCPRKWFFSHVEGLEPQSVASSLLFGSAIHAALQLLEDVVDHDVLLRSGRGLPAAQLAARSTTWLPTRSPAMTRRMLPR